MTVEYLTLQRKHLMSARHEFRAKLIEATGELNSFSVRQHIIGLRNGGGQMGMPGGVDEGFIGIIRVSSRDFKTFEIEFRDALLIVCEGKIEELSGTITGDSDV